MVKPEEIEAMFAPALAIDLYYDAVKKFTEWPTRDHSIKTLAKYLPGIAEVLFIVQPQYQFNVVALEAAADALPLTLPNFK